MITVDDHQLHAQFFYYPSNVFNIGSEEEYLFFKNKWSSKSDRRRVQRIYSDYQQIGICPCRTLFAFNVLNASLYKNTHLRKLAICNNECSSIPAITRVAFYNEYQMKTIFFTKRCDETIKSENVIEVSKKLPRLLFECEILNLKDTIKRNKIGKKSIQTLKKVQRINQVHRMITSLKKDIDELQRCWSLLRGESSYENKKTIVILSRLILKRAHSKYLKLDYFSRFSAVLTDIKMYIPKISKNKTFKLNMTKLKETIKQNCLIFWGISTLRSFLGNENCPQNILPAGQLLTMNDNPKHKWYNLKSICRHENGYNIEHSQRRCNDEMISSFKYCKTCSRRLLY